MKISYNWLKDYLSLDISPAEVAAALTSAGLEVEDIIEYESVKGSLKGVVTGKVVECRRHPNADKLSLTKVDVGQGNLLSIVCGAPNVAEGQTVLVATVGTTLYKGEEAFQIRQAKIRGELSEGMICAEDELGLGNSHDGIMVLDNAIGVGRPASELFNVVSDTVFEIGLTPNRADAASHIGVARDLMAVLNHRAGYKKYALTLPDTSNFATGNPSLPIRVIVEDTEACPRYSGLSITNLRVGPSPEWLQNRLKAIGLRPINNVVDITNYVLFETGQPLHAFDAAAVTGNTVVVKKLPKDTPFVTLDGVERKLTGNDLMICNASEGMCIGGVFGGLHSGVTESTTAIFLESACFDPRTIRRTARHHDLHTDASFRFERGTDIQATVFALKRAAQLIKEVCGGEVASEIIDVYPQPRERALVQIDFGRLDKLAGQHIPATQVLAILEDLDFYVVEKNETTASLSVPTAKVDVYREADIAEEVLRIYGYDNIRIPEKINASPDATQSGQDEALRHAISDMLAAKGFNEIMNNSLTKSEYTASHPAFDSGKNVSILNPLSSDLNVLRQSLLFGGLETIAYNQNRKQTDLRLFEFGKTYHFDPGKLNQDQPLAPYSEFLRLSMLITGMKQAESWLAPQQPADFFDMKQIVEALISRLRIQRNLFSLSTFGDSLFDAGLQYSINNVALIRFGQLSKQTTRAFDIRKPVFWADVAWEELLSFVPKRSLTYVPVPKFPSVRRDLALVIDKHITYAELESAAYKTAGQLLSNINLFDIYEGDKIPAGKKSYAISFVLVSPEKTLTDKEIDQTMERLINTFSTQFGASLRQ
ncbi:MAG: phenylalanine--tRNA ligase subunit beta [Bacteroidetes bacterium]|nr:phenylalanine--tRNA ligase subunit beta [Bacteroidota bacterium]